MADPALLTAEDDRGRAASPASDAPDPVLAIRDVSKRFGGLQALGSVDLDLRPGEIHCLLGENGAGKSTLCNVIFGLHPPDAGTLLLRGTTYAPKGPQAALSAGIAMVHQHFSLVPELSVLENLCLGGRGRFDRRREAERFAAIAGRFGIAVPFDARVEALSVGERQRVEILKCLSREPGIVVLDEPTAVLPPGEIDALLDLILRMASDGKAILLVTHKLAESERVADRITVLRHGRVTLRARGGDVGRAELAAAIVGAPVGVEDPDEIARGSDNIASDRYAPPGSSAAPAALMLDTLSVADEAGAEKVSRITLLMPPGEIVGVAGVEGNGQSELALALAGLLPTSHGRFFVADRELTRAAPGEVSAAGVGIVPEDRQAVGGILGRSVAENIDLGALAPFRRGPFVDRRAMNRAAEGLIERFDIRCSGPGARFESLSGGNQQKVVLARELTLNARHLLVAAQPTRGLDIGATRATYGHIRAAARGGAGVLLISSELDDLLAICDRIVVMYRGRFVGEMASGSYDRQKLGALMAGHVT